MSVKKESEQLIRIGVLQNLDRVLLQFGLDAEAELAKLDMNAGMLRDGELLTHASNIGAVLEHCARVTGCPDFSLRLAAVQDMSLAGVLGLFVQTASTLGEALQEICQYNHVHHAQPVTWRLQDLGNAATFDIFLDAEGLSPQQYKLAVDLGVSQGYRMIKTLSEGRVRLNQVRFRRGDDKTQGMQDYRLFFQAPIEFNAEADGLVLPAGSLDLPLVHPDAQMHEAVRQQISPIGTDGEVSLVQEVRAIIHSLLPTGDYSLERIARCYACDKRTLQRYLRDEADTTYQVLLDDVRFDLVQQYLRDSQMPMTQITYVAGFADPSNFARAFRKRFGMPPKQWREQHRDSRSPSRTRRSSLRGSLS
jgi:AraC-like DNA-binding protein